MAITSSIQAQVAYGIAMTTSYDVSTWRCLTMMGSWSSRGSCGGSRYTHQASFKCCCSYSWMLENLLGSSTTSSLYINLQKTFILSSCQIFLRFFVSLKTIPKKVMTRALFKLVYYKTLNSIDGSFRLKK